MLPRPGSEGFSGNPGGFPVIRGVFWGLQACSLALWGRVARTFGHPRRDVRRLLAPPRVIGEDLVALATRIRGVSEGFCAGLGYPFEIDFMGCAEDWDTLLRWIS